eukprot:g8565.t1
MSPRLIRHLVAWGKRLGATAFILGGMSHFSLSESPDQINLPPQDVRGGENATPSSTKELKEQTLIKEGRAFLKAIETATDQGEKEASQKNAALQKEAKLQVIENRGEPSNRDLWDLPPERVYTIPWTCEIILNSNLPTPPDNHVNTTCRRAYARCLEEKAIRFLIANGEGSNARHGDLKKLLKSIAQKAKKELSVCQTLYAAFRNPDFHVQEIR